MAVTKCLGPAGLWQPRTEGKGEKSMFLGGFPAEEGGGTGGTSRQRGPCPCSITLCPVTPCPTCGAHHRSAPCAAGSPRPLSTHPVPASKEGVSPSLAPALIKFLPAASSTRVSGGSNCALSVLRVRA